ncbi:hypothetical protein EYC84_004662 [Monilinia fructicola]|uniref:Uncharacterized protein n=1 Tax=Monilinia fructicola TaxID=38448 RepID=A0A5M9K4A1_MONFR|nr:hypothetical protein EYC84_004662 [Monilinia fructicola]
MPHASSRTAHPLLSSIQPRPHLQRPNCTASPRSAVEAPREFHLNIVIGIDIAKSSGFGSGAGKTSPRRSWTQIWTRM